RHCMMAVTMRVFVFQAEDGIRDATVTGVQTCALPISKAPETAPPTAENVVEMIEFRGARRVPQDTLRALIMTKKGDIYNEDALRSEERRVGKECRSG